MVSLSEALDNAKDASLDLVEISPNAEPPVCRVMDYGKYQYEASKKKASQKKKTKTVQVKEVKMRPGTDIGDYQIKLKKAIAFLEKGNKVKFTVRFKGREIMHYELGIDMLKRIEHDIQAYGNVEASPKQEGRQIFVIVSPLQTK